MKLAVSKYLHHNTTKQYLCTVNTQYKHKCKFVLHYTSPIFSQYVKTVLDISTKKRSVGCRVLIAPEGDGKRSQTVTGRAFFVKMHLPFSLNYLARGHWCCCCLVDTNWPKVKRAFTMRQKVEGSENEAGQTETRTKITTRWKACRYYVWRQLHEMQKK